MSYPVYIYFIEFCTNLRQMTEWVLGTGVCIVSTVVLVSLISNDFVGFGDEARKYQSRRDKLLMATIAFMFVFGVIYTVTPRPAAMYAMAGASALEEVVKSPDVKRLNNKVLLLVEGEMDKYILQQKKGLKND